MDRRKINRRSFIRFGGSITVAGVVSGCTDESDSSEQSPDDTATPPQTETEVSRDTSTPDDTTETEDSSEPEESVELGHLHEIAGDTAPPDISGHHNRRYEWETHHGEWWLELNIQQSVHEYYEARHRQHNRGAFVSDPYDNGYIEFISNELKSLGNEYSLSDREVVDLAMAFVQQLRYTPDEVATGFTQHTYYPVETLVDRGGDCEDTSILLAAILRDLGYDCVLLALWDAEHMALGVKGDHSIPGTYYEYQGERYYYVETTGSGWGVGELPPNVENTNAEIQEIHSHPTLVYAWESVARDDDVQINAAVRNVGQESASNVVFAAEFEDQSEEVRAFNETEVGLIGRDEIKTVTTVLNPPDDATLRLNTGVWFGETPHDVRIGEWRRPV